MRTVSEYTLLLLGTAAALVQAGVQSHGPRRLSSNAHSKTIQKRAFTGQGSFYNAETGNAGACGAMLSNSGWTVALNTAQWDGGSHCNQPVTITWGGVTQTATVVDQCPGCGYGGLDLTPSLFSAFADQSVGIIQMSWVFGSGGGGGGNDAPSSGSSSQWTPPSTSSTPAWTPAPPPPPKTSSTPQWTPEYTPPTTSSTRRTSSTPEYTWTPPSSSSSSKWTSSSPAWTPSSSHVYSSSSSSLAPSSSSSSSIAPTSKTNTTSTSYSSTANATSSSVPATASASMFTSTIALADGQSTTATMYRGPDGAVHTQTPASSYVGGGSLQNVNQAILQMAGLLVSSADDSA